MSARLTEAQWKALELAAANTLVGVKIGEEGITYQDIKPLVHEGLLDYGSTTWDFHYYVTDAGRAAIAEARRG